MCHDILPSIMIPSTENRIDNRRGTGTTAIQQKGRVMRRLANYMAANAGWSQSGAQSLAEDNWIGLDFFKAADTGCKLGILAW